MATKGIPMQLAAIQAEVDLIGTGDAVAVAADLASHEADTTVHGATGDVQGADDVTAALSDPVIDTVRDSFGNIIVQFNPGGAASVQHLNINSAATGAPVSLSVTAEIGGDANVDLDLQPLGTGITTENGTALALGTGAAAPTTVGIVDTVAKDALDDIIAALQAARILAP